jgi:nucleotide-binding universal stress UspA family protein
MVWRANAGLTVEHRLEDGLLADTILCVACEGGADRIVLVTRGRSGQGRLLLGSGAARVVRLTPSAVPTASAVALRAPTA